jgi:hypothetical protein
MAAYPETTLFSFQPSSHLQLTVDVARLFPEMTHHAKRLIHL